ncbi:MAG TPA: glycosyl hydrolase [Actinoplanes sp.]|nr:glycosyl hydrolase [Actinoplanes sp.]
MAIVAVLSAAVVFTVRSQDGGEADRHAGTTGGPPAAAAFGHVHGLAVDHGTGGLYAATHVGLFRIDAEHTAVRVSAEATDLMGFTAVGPGHFLASGHPDAHSDGPGNLGLIESTDGGATWKAISLSGAADFHGLQAAHGAVYGYNSTDGAFLVSADRQRWERRSTTALGAFRVSPTEPQVILAVGQAGLQRSTDGGRTWAPVGGAPPVGVLAWEQGAEVIGADRDGVVWRSADGGTSWQQRGRLPAQPHVLAVHESTLFAAVSGDEIVASTDGGATWTRRYAPAR